MTKAGEVFIVSATIQKNLYYDPAAIKDLSILAVADMMGIKVRKRGKNYWCKIRDEKEPSVVLHPDTNYFYDFGNQVHGDVIAFVRYAKDLSYGAALHYLGEAFGLKPCMTRQQLMDRPLTNWEYSRIGLHGDMATKNFVFPIETLPIQELAEIGSSYRMPLNQLLRKAPEVYRSLIRHTAMPYVENLRNSYYLDIWNYFHLVYAMGDNSTNLYSADKVRDRFKKDTSLLNKAEQVLYRAGKNAGLDVPEPSRHDPVAVIRQLLHGNLPITLGNTSRDSLSRIAQETGCTVLEGKVSFYSYFDERLLGFRHAAAYQGGEVSVQYLSSDASHIRPLLQELSAIPSRPLEAQIKEAAQKRQSKELQSAAPEKIL